jgi:Flp pilus assembly protein TadD
MAGYAAALQRWPDNQAAAIGLASRHHARGELAQAVAVLREAYRRHPASTIVRNNLSQMLSDQGRNAEALALIEPLAADAGNPFASEVRATREQILQRMRQSGTAQAPRP